MATVAIGDVHGHLEALDDVLNLVLPTLAPGDTLVLLGDYVDRGPDNRGVLERLCELRASPPAGVDVQFLLGNHEAWLLDTYRDPQRHSWLLSMDGWNTVASYDADVADTLLAQAKAAGPRLLTEKLALPYERFFEAMPPEHLTFLQELVPFVRTPNVVCVHGGVDPTLGPVEEQPAKRLPWGDVTFPKAYAGDDAIVYGHKNDAVLDDAGWPHPRVLPNRTYGLDTIFHGVLTAMRFPGEEVIQSRRYPRWEAKPGQAM